MPWNIVIMMFVKYHNSNQEKYLLSLLKQQTKMLYNETLFQTPVAKQKQLLPLALTSRETQSMCKYMCSVK